MLPPMTIRLRAGFEDIVESSNELWTVQTAGTGPRGSLPLTGEMLIEWSSGDLFGLTQNAGMGWDPRELTRPQFLMLSTQGGEHEELRARELARVPSHARILCQPEEVSTRPLDQHLAGEGQAAARSGARRLDGPELVGGFH